MFKDDPDKKAKAEAAATALSDHADFKSHGRFIDREQARKRIGLLVDDFEADKAVENAALGLFHATSHTFNSTPAVKLLENHRGRAFIKLAQMIQVPMHVRPAAPAPGLAQPQPPQPPAPPQQPPPAATAQGF